MQKERERVRERESGCEIKRERESALYEIPF